MSHIGIRGFSARSIVFGLFLASIIFSASVLDGTLIMAGDSRGLLEHPAIWFFIILLIAIPICLRSSVAELISCRLRKDIPFSRQFRSCGFKQALSTCQSDFRGRSRLAKTLISIFTAIGVVAFSWNSIQNQMPIASLGFDFWDSANHSWGYWTTRGIKFYMWVIFFPQMALAQTLLLISVRRILRKAKKERSYELNIFHPDRAGGLRALIDSILRPLLPLVLLSGITTLFVVLIHKKVDTTTGLAPVFGPIPVRIYGFYPDNATTASGVLD